MRQHPPFVVVTAGKVNLRHTLLLPDTTPFGTSAHADSAAQEKLYYRVMHRREQARAEVVVTHHLLVHAFIRLRDGIDYDEFELLEGSSLQAL